MIRTIAPLVLVALVLAGCDIGDAAPGPKNPCDSGYEYNSATRTCGRKLANTKPTSVEPCEPGKTREVKRGKFTIIQTCGYVK
jgi:hypothetical protein